MLPDIDLRLTSVLKALNEVILPALPDDQSMAREQAHLVVAHLGIIAVQWKHALKFELAAYDAMRSLAQTLRPHAGADSERIDAALDGANTLDRSNYCQVSAAARELGALVAEVIDDDGSTAAMDVSLQAAVLAHAKQQALRERAWFAACALDPDAARMPSFETLLS